MKDIACLLSSLFKKPETSAFLSDSFMIHNVNETHVNGNEAIKGGQVWQRGNNDAYQLFIVG